MEEQTMKYGVIDVGGGLRGIYGAGVLDRCLEEDLRFDLCIGVSAGSANMASYLAGQHGRNKPFYDEYSFRREYMSVHNLIRKHSYLDLGYVYGTLSNAGGENPLDYAALARSPAELCVVAANAQNGEAQYFHQGRPPPGRLPRPHGVLLHPGHRPALRHRRRALF